ncbi:MAG: hypothetical protein ABJK28_06200 [Algibacter sp.]
MKSIVLKVFTIVLLTNLFCCSNNESLINNLEYDNSLKAWQNLKQSNGTSYKYEVKFGSVFGFGSQTTITVKDGIVISRTYEAYSIYDDNGQYTTWENRIITETYYEDFDNLNTHDNGAQSLTVDELYTLCLKDYLNVDSSKNTIYFSVDNSDIIEACNYYPHGCQDDCTIGIGISDFEWINNTCSVSDPIEDLDWLKTLIEDTQKYRGFQEGDIYISQVEYEENTLFIFGNCCATCNSVFSVYNCEGDIIGRLGYDVEDDFVYPFDLLALSSIIWTPPNFICDGN